MKKIIYIFIVNMVLFTNIVHAKDSSKNWNVLHNGQGSIIEVYDNERKSNVIEFSSHSNKDTYINGAKKGERAWNNRKSKTIQWSFKYNQNYVIIVTLATIKGYRSLVYTANEKNFKSYIGLGGHTIKGEWVTITRNLKEDLRQQDPTNKILAVNGFAIRGDGKISDLHMLKVLKRSILRSFYQTIQEALLYLRNKKFIKESIKSTESSATKNAVKEHIDTTADNKNVPTVTLLNGNKIYLNLGEAFIDPGVIAKDSNGVALDVEVIGDVNVSRVDRYSLHYLAIDKNGNATSVTRLVIILSDDIEDVKVKKIDNDIINEDTNSSEEDSENNFEADELEELYQQDIIDSNPDSGENEIDNGNAEVNNEEAQEIDLIFQNAEGDNSEEKLQDIATKLEELMDRGKE